MRRRVVRFEMSPRFSASKAPFGDQRELSAKLTERIRTSLFRLYQRWNETGQRIRLLRIRIGTVRFAALLLHNSSVSFADSSFYTKEPLDGANAQHLKDFRSPPLSPPAGAPSPHGEGFGWCKPDPQGEGFGGCTTQGSPSRGRPGFGQKPKKFEVCKKNLFP